MKKLCLSFTIDLDLIFFLHIVDCEMERLCSLCRELLDNIKHPACTRGCRGFVFMGDLLLSWVGCFIALILEGRKQSIILLRNTATGLRLDGS
jgi:hypothetical protein